MDLRLKHRLVGAVVLIAVGVIFIPMLLDGPPPAPEPVTLERIPPAPGADHVPRRVDLELPPPAGAGTAAAPPASPSPTAPADGTDGPAEAWVIQIGSFSQADNARALRDRLRQEGYAAFDERITGADGKPTTRVRIGPDLDRAKLERQLATLHKEPEFAAALILRHP
jgi:DedD protein